MMTNPQIPWTWRPDGIKLVSFQLDKRNAVSFDFEEYQGWASISLEFKSFPAFPPSSCHPS